MHLIGEGVVQPHLKACEKEQKHRDVNAEKAFEPSLPEASKQGQSDKGLSHHPLALRRSYFMAEPEVDRLIGFVQQIHLFLPECDSQQEQ